MSTSTSQDEWNPPNSAPPIDITEPTVKHFKPDVGRYDELDEEIYHGRWNAWNNTRMKSFDTSPAHCKYMIEHPESKPQTDALKLGSAMHCALLEPDRFEDKYLVEITRKECIERGYKPKSGSDGTFRNCKAYREAKADLADGVEWLQPDDRATCLGLRDRILSTPGQARDLLLATTATEVSFAEDDPITGLRCKIRTDALAPGIVWDLKKCESIWRFEKHMYELRYFMAAPFYLDVLDWHHQRIKSENGAHDHFTIEEPIEHFMFLTVEDKPPYEFKLLQLDSEGMQLGSNKYRGILNAIAVCVERDEWPGYNRKLETISLPGYAYTEEEF